jgi:hypothetical protein
MSTQTFARATQFFAMATLDRIVATRMKYLQNSQVNNYLIRQGVQRSLHHPVPFSSNQRSKMSLLPPPLDVFPSRQALQDAAQAWAQWLCSSHQILRQKPRTPATRWCRAGTRLGASLGCWARGTVSSRTGFSLCNSQVRTTLLQNLLSRTLVAKEFLARVSLLMPYICQADALGRIFSPEAFSSLVFVGFSYS